MAGFFSSLTEKQRAQTYLDTFKKKYDWLGIKYSSALYIISFMMLGLLFYLFGLFLILICFSILPIIQMVIMLAEKKHQLVFYLLWQLKWLFIIIFLCFLLEVFESLNWILKSIFKYMWINPIIVSSNFLCHYTTTSPLYFYNSFQL